LIPGGPTHFEVLSLRDGTDWLMRPVLHGMIRYTDLLDGSLNLVDIARMNDAIDIQAENRRRAEEAARKG